MQEHENTSHLGYQLTPIYTLLNSDIWFQRWEIIIFQAKEENQLARDKYKMFGANGTSQETKHMNHRLTSSIDKPKIDFLLKMWHI